MAMNRTCIPYGRVCLHAWITTHKISESGAFPGPGSPVERLCRAGHRRWERTLLATTSASPLGTGKSLACRLPGISGSTGLSPGGCSWVCRMASPGQGSPRTRRASEGLCELVRGNIDLPFQLILSQDDATQLLVTLVALSLLRPELWARTSLCQCSRLPKIPFHGPHVNVCKAHFQDKGGGCGFWKISTTAKIIIRAKSSYKGRYRGLP